MKSVDYLHNHTSLKIPEVHNQNTTIKDVLSYVHNVISHPQEIGNEIPKHWNETIHFNTKKVESFAFASFIPFFKIIKPYLVILMSLLE